MEPGYDAIFVEQVIDLARMELNSMNEILHNFLKGCPLGVVMSDHRLTASQE